MRGDVDITKRALPAALFVHVALALAVLAAALQPRPPAAPPPPIEPSYEVTLTAPPSPSPSPSPLLLSPRRSSSRGIEVVDCDSGGWANATELALDALRGKKLSMPSTAKRATMRIEIVSEMKMPSGHDPGVDVSILGVPITKGDGRQATQVRLLDSEVL